MPMKRTIVYDEYYSRSEIRTIILVNKKDMRKLKHAIKKVIEENGWEEIIKVTSSKHYKEGYHITWNNKKVYLRSSYENVKVFPDAC